MSKILFVSSEAYPLIKTGGLADVAGSLPIALQKEHQDVRLLLPAYRQVLAEVTKTKLLASTSYYNIKVDILETRLPGSKVKVWLVNSPTLFDRNGSPYLDANGDSWHDNALRFAVFCKVATDIALDRLTMNWHADIVHCNDWQTGLVPALLSMHAERPATVFTIHNLSYQGLFDYQTYIDLALPEEFWHMHSLEFYGQLSFIKGGLVYADIITTVSPTYAHEILGEEFGCGLDGLLNSRSQSLFGIINGIDYTIWNPGSDAFLQQKFNIRSLSKKSINKTALQQSLSLPVDASTPMLGMISRLVQQKGLDIILESLPTLLELSEKDRLQIVILGTGETHYEMLLLELAAQYPERLKVIIGYDEALAHNIEAACDLYLMPSIFEPCGLNQLYSLRYGTLPIVTPVGGLADTVIDASDENISANRANGFVQEQQTPAALLNSVKRALLIYKKPDLWRQLQICGMSADFSWQSSARSYVALYEKALEELTAS